MSMARRDPEYVPVIPYEVINEIANLAANPKNYPNLRLANKASNTYFNDLRKNQSYARVRVVTFSAPDDLQSFPYDESVGWVENISYDLTECSKIIKNTFDLPNLNIYENESNLNTAIKIGKKIAMNALHAMNDMTTYDGRYDLGSMTKRDGVQNIDYYAAFVVEEVCCESDMAAEKMIFLRHVDALVNNINGEDEQEPIWPKPEHTFLSTPVDHDEEVRDRIWLTVAMAAFNEGNTELERKLPRMLSKIKKIPRPPPVFEEGKSFYRVTLVTHFAPQSVMSAFRAHENSFQDLFSVPVEEWWPSVGGHSTKAFDLYNIDLESAIVTAKNAALSAVRGMSGLDRVHGPPPVVMRYYASVSVENFMSGYEDGARYIEYIDSFDNSAGGGNDFRNSELFCVGRDVADTAMVYKMWYIIACLVHRNIENTDSIRDMLVDKTFAVEVKAAAKARKAVAEAEAARAEAARAEAALAEAEAALAEASRKRTSAAILSLKAERAAAEETKMGELALTVKDAAQRNEEVDP
jgi:hypothetical protein